MSDFMNSEFVQQELDDIQRLQEEIYADFFYYDTLDNEDKIEHLDKLQQLLEKQSIVYTRMSLSDDPDAIERKEFIRDFMLMMGFDNAYDVNAVFAEMRETIKEMKNNLDT